MNARVRERNAGSPDAIVVPDQSRKAQTFRYAGFATARRAIDKDGVAFERNRSGRATPGEKPLLGRVSRGFLGMFEHEYLVPREDRAPIGKQKHGVVCAADEGGWLAGGAG